MIVQNGKLIEEDVIALDGGYAFGKGFFETIHVTDRPLFMNEHVDRINNSLAAFGFDRRVEKMEVVEAVELLACSNEALKLMVSEKQTLFSKRPFNYTKEQYKKGISLTRNPACTSSKNRLARHKTLNYWQYLLQMEEARSKGFFDSYSVNEMGQVTETAIANLFIIENGKLVTPPVESGLLPGIVRNWVQGTFDVVKKAIDEKELLGSDGAFLTNSLMGIMPIGSIDGKEMGRPAQIEAVMKKYAEETGVSYGTDR